MSKEIRVPQLGESVSEATIAQWLKSVGDQVSADEPLVELETDKVSVEVPAPSSGVLSEIVAKDGETVEVGALLGSIGEGNGAAKKAADAKPDDEKSGGRAKTGTESSGKKESPKPSESEESSDDGQRSDVALSPAVRRLVAEEKLDVSQIEGTGKGGRITKEDALKAAREGTSGQSRSARAPSEEQDKTEHPSTESREERVPMSRLRQTIARRLKEAQDTAAMLTTFNEVDMSNVLAMRGEFKDLFEKKHGVRLGLMGFFIKAAIAALRDIPAVNAEIDGTDIVYKNHYDIGVAVGTEKGLVVPVLRDADAMGLADIEKAINEYAAKARDGSLKLEDLQGGTFTLSNGGVYGWLMSTPIQNDRECGR